MFTVCSFIVFHEMIYLIKERLIYLLRFLGTKVSSLTNLLSCVSVRFQKGVTLFKCLLQYQGIRLFWKVSVCSFAEIITLSAY